MGLADFIYHSTVGEETLNSLVLAIEMNEHTE